MRYRLHWVLAALVLTVLDVGDIGIDLVLVLNVVSNHEIGY